MASRYFPPSMTFSPSHRSLSTSPANPFSPPSLAYSDGSIEDYEVCLPSATSLALFSTPEQAPADQTSIKGIMTVGSEPPHVSDMMADALSHLNRVVEHLRDEGENEAANGIARDVHSMLDTFNHTTAPWPIEKFHMKPPPASKVQLIANGAANRPVSRPNASSWAAIAATDIAGNNRLVKFRPSDGVKRHITEEELNKPKPREEDFRCIWIYGWPKHKPLSVVTDRISTGAIFSMAHVEQYEAVCIIFQYASAAMLFLEEEDQSVRNFGVGLFGKGHQVKYGEGFPENDDLVRMQPPLNERRRLTFARQQLFTNGMSEERFRKDLIDVVGSHNLELVWLFNTGNATAVFSSTVVARIVRDEFMRRSRRSGPYQEVQIGFSHDPCERPMNLITQIPYPGTAPRNRSDSCKSGAGGRLYNPGGAKFVPGVAARVRRGTDSDGWQTVQRKR